MSEATVVKKRFSQEEKDKHLSATNEMDTKALKAYCAANGVSVGSIHNWKKGKTPKAAKAAKPAKAKGKRGRPKGSKNVSAEAAPVASGDASDVKSDIKSYLTANFQNTLSGQAGVDPMVENLLKRAHAVL